MVTANEINLTSLPLKVLTTSNAATNQKLQAQVAILVHAVLYHMEEFN